VAVKGLTVVALLIATMLWLAGAFVDKVEPGPPRPRPRPAQLKTERVEGRLFPLVMEQVGSLRARSEAQVSARIMAQVKEVLVREGEGLLGPAAPGGPTVLARLDDRDIVARLDQARAQIQASDRALQAARARLEATRAQSAAAATRREQARTEFRRTEGLHRDQAATGQQMDHARAQRDVAEAQAQAAAQEMAAAEEEIQGILARRKGAEAAAAEAGVMLSHTVLQAPFSGRLVRKMVEVGDTVGPGRPLFIVETPSLPELHAVVSESLLHRLRMGQPLTVRVDALEREFQGEVREIVPRADPATRTVMVKVALPPEPELVSGLFGRLFIPHGEYRALVVSRAAVRTVGQLHLVDALDAQGHPQRRFVTLGSVHGDRVEILSGLREGEEVLLP
jgi:multidrug resistance efflux pump